MTRGGAKAIGLAAVVFSALYFVSDLIEAQQGGFSDFQLWLTLVAEAAVPVFIVGLVNGTKDYATLSDDLGAVMIIHGAVMVVAGLGFGDAVLRARLLPAWSAVAFMVGVLLVAVAQGLPESAQLTAAGVRAFGLAGMGAGLLRTTTRTPLIARSISETRTAA